MLEINKYSNILKKNENGFWTSDKLSSISFPSEAHNRLLKIEGSSFWFAHRNLCIFEIIKRFPPESFLIDVGGGNGYVTTFLQKNGIETVLLEPNIQGVQNALTRGVKNIIHSSFENAAFIQGSIPNIGLFDVLEHIEDELILLKKIFSVLKKNGNLYLTVPSYNFLWTKCDEYAGHYRRYNINILINKLKKIGFEIKYTTYFFKIMPLAIFLLRKLPEIFSFSCKKNPWVTAEMEHKERIGITKWFLSNSLNSELFKIKNSKIHFGSSCFCVAKRP